MSQPVADAARTVTAGRPPAMTDVARLAGVSHQTVSRVLNDHPSVRPDTRDRVLSAIEELGYRRNTAARTLVTGRSETLGLVSFDTTLYGPASTVYGIEQAAREAGYFISIASLAALDRTSVRDAVDRLIAQLVDGIMIVAPLASVAAAISTLPRHLPVVSVQGGPEEDIAQVVVDHESGARQATEHLLELGHTQIWHVAGPSGWIESRQRLTGWRDTLREAGIRPQPPLIGEWTARSGYEIGMRVAKIRKMTAVFVANDQMAMGLIRAMNESGRRVPDDVSVVGFDDVPEAEFLSPPLTTVRQDFAEVGRRSFALLRQQLDRGPAWMGDGVRLPRPRGAKVVVPAQLIVRASTAGP